MQASVQLASTRENETVNYGNGMYQGLQEMDFVLLFDGKSMRLERLTAAISNLQCAPPLFIVYIAVHMIYNVIAGLYQCCGQVRRSNFHFEVV